MALSGSLAKKYFYGNTHCHWIEWAATQNIANNQSTVTIAFKSTWTSGFGTYSESKNINQIRLNGTNYTRSTSITGSVGTITQFSTTQVITHNSDGTATFKLGGRHRLNSSYGDYVYWNDVTFTLDTIPQTSACSAPTSVTIAASKINKGQTTTISWSGAKAGTLNAITGYRIYYKSGSQPTTSSDYVTVTTSSTSGSYKTTTSFSNTEGVVWYFKVRTLGAAGSSYWSGLSSSSTTLTININPTVKFYRKQAMTSADLISTHTVTYGGSVATPPNPTLSGYVFLGYWTTPEGDRVDAGSSVTNVTRDMNFRAVWREVTSYTVNFYRKMAMAPTDLISTHTVVPGGSVAVPPDPTLIDYYFKGYWTTPEGDEVNAGGSVTNVTRDMNFRAVWDAGAPFYVGRGSITTKAQNVYVGTSAGVKRAKAIYVGTAGGVIKKAKF